MKWAAGRNLIGRRLFVVAVAAIVASPAFPLELPRAAALIGRILELRRASTVRARGRLVVTGARNERRVFQIQVLQKPLARSTNLLWSVTEPPEARTRILVESPLQGGPTVWLVSGARGAAAVLPADRWARVILGSHLTVEDLIDDYLTWPRQSVTGEEAVSEKMCYVLRSEPAEGHASTYGSVTTWVDQATLVPLRILKEPRGPGAPKEIVCRGVRQSRGHWAASNIEVRIRGAAGSTRIVFTGGSENARVTDSEVDPKSALGSDPGSR
jgi:hypothetical protein